MEDLPNDIIKEIHSYIKYPSNLKQVSKTMNKTINMIEDESYFRKLVNEIYDKEYDLDSFDKVIDIDDKKTHNLEPTTKIQLQPFDTWEHLCKYALICPSIETMYMYLKRSLIKVKDTNPGFFRTDINKIIMIQNSYNHPPY